MTTDRMTQSMMKMILLALLTFSMRTGAASAQSRTFYDAHGDRQPSDSGTAKWTATAT
jgi:hypothetical protein